MELGADGEESLGNLLSREEEMGGGRIMWKFFIWKSCAEKTPQKLL